MKYLNKQQNRTIDFKRMFHREFEDQIIALIYANIFLIIKQ